MTYYGDQPMRDSDIDSLSADALQESPIQNIYKSGPTLLDERQPRSFAVQIDVNKWDPDEGRAWITVTAANALDAMDRVRSMYPSAAVLMAEEA